MVFIACSESHLAIAFDRQLHVQPITAGTSAVGSFQLQLPPPAPADGADKARQDPNPSAEQGALCGGFSSDGRWLAVCDLHKRLLVWQTEAADGGRWRLHRSFALEKRSVCVRFVHGEDVVLGERHFSTSSCFQPRNLPNFELALNTYLHPLHPPSYQLCCLSG